jgi:aspartate aminotransferase
MKLSSFANRIVGQSMFKILAAAQELERTGKKLIHFEIGDTHLDMPAIVKDAAIAALKNNRTHYGPSAGEFILRSAIVKAVHEDYGFAPDIGQVAVASGANPLIYYLIAILVNAGEEVIITDPAFVTYNAVFSMLRIKDVRVPITHRDNFRFSPAAIAKRITKKTRLIIINSPQNPTGAVYSEKDIRAIYALAKKHNLYIISDEIYSSLVYEGEHFSAGMLDKCRERVIVTHGFSKPFSMTGWRVGYAIGPTPVIEKVILLSQTIVSCVPSFLQDACVVALKNRKKLSAVYKAEYEKLRAVACAELEKAKNLSFARPAGAFYLFIDVSKTGMDGDAFAKLLIEKAGVVVCPGSGFGAGGKNYIRICYARNKDELVVGCRKIAAVAGSSVP